MMVGNSRSSGLRTRTSRHSFAQPSRKPASYSRTMREDTDRAPFLRVHVRGCSTQSRHERPAHVSGCVHPSHAHSRRPNCDRHKPRGDARCCWQHRRARDGMVLTFVRASVPDISSTRRIRFDGPLGHKHDMDAQRTACLFSEKRLDGDVTHREGEERIS